MSISAADESGDVASGFAALMNKAAEQAAGETAEAPFGYTTDKDGTTRPKKAQGRPRKSPSVDELKEQKAATSATAATAGVAGEGDRAPDTSRRRRRGKSAEAKPAAPVPQFREGVIEKGINKLYRRAGKMVRVMDRDIGQALIDITVKDEDDDVTVGAAWEELARTNPRIRKFLLKIIAGGAVGQLFMCHAPVLLAVLMKDAIRKRIPFHRLIEAYLDGGEDGEAPADGTVMEGMTMPDFDAMMSLAQQVATQMGMGGRMPGGPTPRPPVPSPVGPGVTTAVPAVSGS